MTANVLTPTRAMVLAAGLGTRMRPITEHTPKPLVAVGGRTMLDFCLDGLGAAGVDTVVVNIHHLPARMRAHLAARRAGPRVIVSDESDALLDSGGGVVKALPDLIDPAAPGRPFVVMNADTIWIDGPRPNLVRLIEAFDPAKSDFLLLLAPSTSSVGYDGRGDFHMDTEGRLARRQPLEVAPFVYAGAFVTTPASFTAAPAGPFSLNRLWDRAIEAGRLNGLRLEGTWMHVGTPGAIGEAEAALAAAAL